MAYTIFNQAKILLNTLTKDLIMLKFDSNIYYPHQFISNNSIIYHFFEGDINTGFKSDLFLLI